ncbi:hypothetical protein OPQ81_011984 [Rhizoctonia solani]|nr:hypothetical protein OPQ81_011984 [Rhizoctonia solani]
MDGEGPSRNPGRAPSRASSSSDDVIYPRRNDNTHQEESERVADPQTAALPGIQNNVPPQEPPESAQRDVKDMLVPSNTRSANSPGVKIPQLRLLHRVLTKFIPPGQAHG